MPPKKRLRTSDTTSSASAASSSSAPPTTTVPSGTVSLNVGGKVYVSTRSTLENAPFFDGLFRAVSSGATTTTKDEDGRFFVDRDSELFPIILQFLRSGLPVQASTEHELATLGAEFEFFGLDKKYVLGPPRKVKQLVRIDSTTVPGYLSGFVFSGTEASLKGLFDVSTLNKLFVEHPDVSECSKSENLSGEAVWQAAITLHHNSDDDAWENDDEEVRRRFLNVKTAQHIFGDSFELNSVGLQKIMGNLDVRAASRGFTKENDTALVTRNTLSAVANEGVKMHTGSVTYVRTIEVHVAQENNGE